MLGKPPEERRSAGSGRDAARPAQKGDGRSGSDRTEFVLTAQDFEQIAAMLHADAGIHLAPSKTMLVYSRLAKRLRSLGLDSFREYCALVAGADGVDERQKMVAALTTNVTRFFREPHHFEHMRTVVLPPLLSAARAGKRVRFWSAASSSGQEPYSMALTVLSVLPEAHALDVRILATDIDPNMVAQATAGIYDEDDIADIPVELRRRHLKPVRGEGRMRWQMSDEVRALVACRELNLIGNWPMKGRFHAVFCRNVVIYFDDPTQQTVWSRIESVLEPEGWLYIGHSERLSGPSAAQFRGRGVTTYQHLGASAGGARASAFDAATSGWASGKDGAGMA